MYNDIDFQRTTRVNCSTAICIDSLIEATNAITSIVINSSVSDDPSFPSFVAEVGNYESPNEVMKADARTIDDFASIKELRGYSGYVLFHTIGRKYVEFVKTQFAKLHKKTNMTSPQVFNQTGVLL